MSLSSLPDELIILLCDNLKLLEIKTLIILYTDDKKEQNHLYKLINLKYSWLIHKYSAIWDFLIEYEPSWNAQFPKYPIDRQKIIDEAHDDINRYIQYNNPNSQYKLSGILLYNKTFVELDKLFIISFNDRVNHSHDDIEEYNDDVYSISLDIFRIETIDRMKMMIEILSLRSSSREKILYLSLLLSLLLKNKFLNNDMLYTFLQFIYDSSHYFNDRHIFYHSCRNIIIEMLREKLKDDEMKSAFIEYVNQW